MGKTLRVFLRLVASFIIGGFLGGVVLLILDLDPEVYTGMALIMTIIAYWQIGRFLKRDDRVVQKNEEEPQEEEEPKDEEPVEKEIDPEEYQELMSGSLVALYKETHDEKYSREYVRRLKKVGFSEPQAQNMFMLEVLILKYDSRAVLSDPSYIYRDYFDLKSNPFPKEDSWYVDHQMFLMSELVKIWDEAEFIWQTKKDEIETEEARERICSISRYGGGQMFMDYMEMLSRKVHTDMELLQAYAKAEQEMLWYWKWKKTGIHPYL